MTESSPLVLKCPVCSARFRGSSTCSRCGSDLTAPMRIAARAWHARQQSRAALRAGDLPRALRWSALAQRLQRVQGLSLAAVGAQMDTDKEA